MSLLFEDVKTIRKDFIGFECDKCGKKYYKDNFVETSEMIHISGKGGYASVWGDGTYYEITLCQKCAYELFGNFAKKSKEDSIVWKD